jgi:hypothetical protein
MLIETNGLFEGLFHPASVLGEHAEMITPLEHPPFARHSIQGRRSLEVLLFLVTSVVTEAEVVAADCVARFTGLTELSR